MNVQMRVRFHNSSPRSHASEDENRTRNGSKNFKCQRAFRKTIVPSCHNPVMEMFHSLFIVLKISMPFSYSLLCHICDFMHTGSRCQPRLQDTVSEV